MSQGRPFDYPSGLPSLHPGSVSTNTNPAGFAAFQHHDALRSYGIADLDGSIQTVLVELQSSREKVASLEAKLVELCYTAAVGYNTYLQNIFDLKVFKYGNEYMKLMTISLIPNRPQA